MALRPPTDTELDYINANIAKKKCSALDCYILDNVSLANDFMLTCYGYYLDTDSLVNFVQDLSGVVPLQINHNPDIPLGRWFNGTLTAVPMPPTDAKPGKRSACSAVLFMPVGLSINGYKTDELVQAYEAGTLTDVSVGQNWSKATFTCDICGNDLLGPEACPHIPLSMYDGVMATVTVHNSHLAEGSLVWSGGLPGATLSMSMEELRAKATAGWDAVKKLGKPGISGSLMSRLSIPIATNREESNMTFKEVQEKFKAELEAEYVSKTEYDRVTNELVAAKELVNTGDTDLDAKAQELADLTEQFAALNAELEANKSLAPIGEKHVGALTEEYNRLGTILYVEKWDHESKGEYLSKMEPGDRVKYLEGEIALLSAGISKIHEKPEHADEPDDSTYSHKNNPALYRM